jgi:sulfatase modifying factor 1
MQSPLVAPRVSQVAMVDRVLAPPYRGSMRGWLALTFVASSGCARMFGLETPPLESPPDASRHEDAGFAVDAPLDAAPALSCEGLPATCGPSGASPCCANAVVPGGLFDRSYDVATDGMFPDMDYPAELSDFRLDNYLVTVGRFRAFVNAGKGIQSTAPAQGAGAHAQIPNSGWQASYDTNLETTTPSLTAALKCDTEYQTWTDAAGSNEDLPMNCMSWYEAMAFCIWDGGYLPTEAEWNYAASGGSEQRAYPWSNPAGSTTIDCTYANYDINLGTMYCVNGSNGATNRVGSESPKGDGRYGQSDLGGNLLQFVLDYYASPYPTMNCDNCANLTPASWVVIRGGSWGDGPTGQRSAGRYQFNPTNRTDGVGLRCARPAP